MKKLVKLIGIATATLAILTGCGVGTPPTRSEAIKDKALVEQMVTDATAVIDHYFDVDVNDGVDREIDPIKTEILVDEATKTYEPLSNIVQATTKADPQEGQLFSYGVVFSPDNTSVQGAIIGYYSEAKVNKYTDEELDVVAKKFITDKKLVDNPENWIFEDVDDSTKKQKFQMVVYKNGDERLLIGISTQTGQVMYFERMPNIEL